MPQSSGSVHFDSLVVDVLSFPKAFHFFALITPRHSACRPISTLLRIVGLTQLLMVGFLPVYLEAKKTNEWTVLAKLFLLGVTGSTDPELSHSELRIVFLCLSLVIIAAVCLGFSFWWFCRRYEVSAFVQHTHATMHFLIPANIVMPLMFVLGIRFSGESTLFCGFRVTLFIILFVVALFCFSFYVQPLWVATPITGETDLFARLVPDNGRQISLALHALIVVTALAIPGDGAKYYFAYCCFLLGLYEGILVWKYPLMADDGTALLIVYWTLEAVIPILGIFKIHYKGSSDSGFLLVIISIGFAIYNIAMRFLTQRRQFVSTWLTNENDLEVESKEELLDICQIAVTEGSITQKLLDFVDKWYHRCNDPDVLLVKVFLHIGERKEPARDFVRSLTALMHYDSMRWNWSYCAYCMFRAFTRCNDILNTVCLTDGFDERIRKYRTKRDMFWGSLIQGKIDLAQKWNTELRDDFLKLRFDYHVMASFYDLHPRIHELNRTFFYEEFSLLEEDPMVAITSKIKNSLTLSLDGTMRIWNYIVGIAFLGLTIMMAWPFARLNTRVVVLQSASTILLETMKISRYWAETAGNVMSIIRENETIWRNASSLERLRTRVIKADHVMTSSLGLLTLVYAESPQYRGAAGRPWFLSKMVHHTYRLNATLLGTVEAFLRSFSGRLCAVVSSDLETVKSVDIRTTQALRQINGVMYAIIENMARRAKAVKDVLQDEVFYGKQFLSIGMAYSLVVSVITYYLSQKLSIGYLSKAPTTHPNPEYGVCAGAVRTPEPGKGGLFFKSFIYQSSLVLLMVGQAWYFYGKMLRSYSSATNENYLVMNQMGQYYTQLALYWMAEAELEVCPAMSEYIDLNKLGAAVVQHDFEILNRIIENRENGMRFIPFSQCVYNETPRPTEQGVHGNWPVGNLLRLATFHIAWDPTQVTHIKYQNYGCIRKRLDKAIVKAETQLAKDGNSAMSAIVFYFAAELFALGMCYAIHYFLCQILIMTFPEREETLFHHIMSLPPQFIANQKGLMEMIVPKMEKERSDKSVSTFLSLFEASYTQLLVVNSNLVIIGFTRPVQTLFGYKYDQLIGQNLEVLIPKSSRESVDNVSLLYDRLFEDENFSIPLIVGRSSDNASVPVSVRITHIIKGYILLEFKSVAEFINFRDVLAKHRELIQDFERSALPVNTISQARTAKKPFTVSFKRGIVVLLGTCHDEVKTDMSRDDLLATRHDLIYGIRYYNGEDGILILAVDCCHILALVVSDEEEKRTDIRRALAFMTRFSRETSLPSFGVAMSVENPEVLIVPLPQMKTRRNLLEQNLTLETDASIVPTMTVDLLTPGLWEAVNASQYVSLRTYLVDDEVIAEFPGLESTEISFTSRRFHKVEIDQISCD